MNILLVDDNSRSREAVGQVLSYLGHCIIQCSDGREACQMLEHIDCDLVITDYDMPRMTGLELLRQMHAQGKDRTEVVVLTGNQQASVMNQVMDEGALAYLLKPINLDQLLKVLRDVGNRNTITLHPAR